MSADSNMSPRKKKAMKPMGFELSGSSQQIVETKSVETVYEDTSILLEKKWRDFKMGRSILYF
jgi:hypothetical protein